MAHGLHLAETSTIAALLLQGPWESDISGEWIEGEHQRGRSLRRGQDFGDPMDAAGRITKILRTQGNDEPSPPIATSSNQVNSGRFHTLDQDAHGDGRTSSIATSAGPERNR
ncbi:MAG: hypothetical protein H7A50_09575 [Akkermansiaceae bacterium]|nr:hypothetical protein [Akkermansiaceae bacterium]